MENQTIKYENKEIEAFIESDYVNLKSGDPAQTFEFLKNREKVVDKIDFNGKPTKKVQFIVINTQDPKRKKLELSRKHIPRIYNELTKGYSVLEILRVGMGKETQYIVKGVK
jgi:hypothetical protein